MYNRYPILVGKCPTCGGCNLLEDVNFKGKQQCENYLLLINPKVQESIKQIHKVLGMDGTQMKL